MSSIIGSGYTGLHAALQTARGGRDTLVLDAEAAGFGCSTRNGGQISTSIKPGFDALARRHGRERALGILREGRNSLAWVGEFVAAEKIDCDFRVVRPLSRRAQSGAIRGAGARGAEPAARSWRSTAHVVPRAEQRNELGTDAYFGGVVYRAARLGRPGPLPSGHARARVREPAPPSCAHCPATGIRRDGAAFRVETAEGHGRGARRRRRDQRLYRAR